MNIEAIRSYSANKHDRRIKSRVEKVNSTEIRIWVVTNSIQLNQLNIWVNATLKVNLIKVEDGNRVY